MGSWGILLLILALLLLRQPLIVLMGAITVYCYYFLPDPPLESFVELNSVIGDLFFAGDKEILLAIPLFIIAGNLMTHGSIARRLIRIAQAMTAPIPAGLAIAGCSLAVFLLRSLDPRQLRLLPLVGSCILLLPKQDTLLSFPWDF